MPADTFKYHANLTQEDGLHDPKYHAALHALGAADELDLASMAFNASISSPIKIYIDSQIAGENHWEIDSGNVLSPVIDGISIDLGTGDLTCNVLNYTTLAPMLLFTDLTDTPDDLSEDAYKLIQINNLGEAISVIGTKFVTETETMIHQGDVVLRRGKKYYLDG